MRNSDFFQQIAHVDVPWGDRTISVPLFYYDISAIGVAFLTPLDKIRKLLPSPCMHPLRVTPWHGMTTINAYEYRDCDLGPYNEVAVGFPITIDQASPVFTGLVRKLPGVPKVYVHHLPVTTEIARDAGVEFANYPKFVASIAFEKKVCTHLPPCTSPGAHPHTDGARIAPSASWSLIPSFGHLSRGSHPAS